jgi:hypothetical protein
MTTVELLMHEYNTLVDLESAVNNPFYALSPLFRLSMSSEMDFLYLINARVTKHLRQRANERKFTVKTKIFLDDLLYHHYHLSRHVRSLQLTINFLTNWTSAAERNGKDEEGPRDPQLPWAPTGPRFIQPRGSPEAPSKTVDSILADYKYALDYAETLLQKCIHGVGVLAQLTAIDEAERSSEETSRVTRLTRLATLFAPLALVTSIFGMNVRELGEDQGASIWLWALVSIIVGGVTAAVMESSDVVECAVYCWRALRRTIRRLLTWIESNLLVKNE